MKKTTFLFGILSFWNCCFAQNLSLNSGTTRAVIIGNLDYQDENIPDLRFANRDAEAFSAFLQSPSGGNIISDDIMLLTNEQATTGAMAGAMDWLIEESKEGDKAIIYFSGHGDVETRTRFQRGFLLTYDSPPSNYLAGAFALIFLQDIITTLSEQGVQVVMISDACRAGKLAGSDVNGAQVTSANLSKQFANEIKILSCQANEFSLEGEQWGGGRGVFSYHLIDGLTGLADNNQDLQVNLLEINRFLEEIVPAETAPQMQIPMVVGNKGTALAHVDEPSLAAVKAQKENAMAAISKIETKGFEEVILADLDSIWQKKYERFTVALEKKELLDPPGTNAYDLYLELSKIDELKDLHGLMKRNLATALQEESQQAINAHLRMDEEYLAIKSRGIGFRKFVRYLEKAAELLGAKHYMYKSLKAKQYYFTAADIHHRLYWQSSNNRDSFKIYKKQVETAVRKAFEFQTNAAFIYVPYANISEDPEARQYYEKAIELSPKSAYAYIALSERLLRDEKPEEAEPYMLKALELAPKSAHIYTPFIKKYKTLKQYDKVEELLEKRVEIAPTNVDYVGQLGEFYYGQKRYEEAEKVFLNLAKITPKDIRVYRALFKIYCFGTKEYDKAEAMNRKRLEIRSYEIAAYQDLINTFVNSERDDKLRQLIEEMKTINDTTENWKGEYLIGRAYTELGECEKALPFFESAVKADSTLNLWNYFNCAYLSKQFELAEELSQRRLDLNPESAGIANGNGWFYKNHGEFELAEKYLKRCIDVDKDHSSAYPNLWKLYYSFGKHKEATNTINSFLARNIELNRQEAIVYSYLCDSAGNPTPIFLEEEKRNPNFSKIRNFLEQFNQK